MTNQNDNKKHHREIFIVWALLTVIGVLVGLYATPWLMPKSASHTMSMGILTMVIFTVAAAPVAALVYAVCLYALTIWRHRGEGVPADGPAIRGNGPATTLWLIGSTVLTLFLLIWGLGLLGSDQSAGAKASIEAANGGSAEITVDVTAQQWLWSFSYPGTHVKSLDLYLPVNKDVEFNVTSKDVVHGFWIVQMGIKVNANPGVITTTSVTPDKIGTYNMRCTEICGLNHAFMMTKVHVLSDADFQKWLASQPTRI